MDILARVALVLAFVPVAILFVGTALTWFAWVISRSDNGW